MARATAFHCSPPPCGEGLGVGVVLNGALRPTPLDADRSSRILNHPHPYPPRKGEGSAPSRFQSIALRNRPQ